MQKRLYSWQNECLQHWLARGGRGIVNVVTGAGKTILGLAAAERLRETQPRLKTYIVVPKTFLALQWARALREELDIKRENIGLVSGKRKDAPNRDFMIYVVNSARYAIARSIVSDFNASRPVLLIADECHHYGTAQNARIFGFMAYIPHPGLYYALGLSATPYSANYKSVLVPALGDEIYHFSFERALRENIINRFVIFHISLSFHPDEQAEYDDYTDSLRKALHRLHTQYPHLRGLHGGAFFAQLSVLAKSQKPNTAELARQIQLLLYRRKHTLYQARERIACVYDLVALVSPQAKIILFTERIETARVLFLALKNRIRGGIGLYHSDQNDNARTVALRRFTDGEIRILISCKALDEGFNVPQTDIGILVSSTNSERQRIQRLGRVLRKSGDSISRLYYLYIENSVEEGTLLHTLSEGLNGIPIIDMSYRQDEGFISPYYDDLSESVIQVAHERQWSLEKMRELMKNLAIGRVACDWLLEAQACQNRIAQAETRAERNYFVTMLMLANAQKNC